MSAARLFFIFSGLVAGHFLYQEFTTEQWMVAMERSYFQGMAFLTLWVFDRLSGSAK